MKTTTQRRSPHHKLVSPIATLFVCAALTMQAGWAQNPNKPGPKGQPGPESTQPMPPRPPAAGATYEIEVDQNGQYSMHGAALSRKQIKRDIVRLHRSKPNAKWIIKVDSRANNTSVRWLWGALEEHNIRSISVVPAKETPPTPQTEKQPGIKPIPKQDPRVVTPSGDVRFSLLADRVDGDGRADNDMSLAFRSTRTALGFDAQINPILSARARINAYEAQANDSDSTASAYAIAVRDLYFDVSPSKHIRVRAGIQSPIFGTKTRFNSPNPNVGYYVATPIYQTMSQAAGLIHSRDNGISIQASLPENRGTLEAMAGNGTGHLTEETNLAKDLSTRFTYNATSKWSLLGSVSRQWEVEEIDACRWAYSFATEWRGDQLRIMGELFGDSVLNAEDQGMGGQISGAYDIPLSSDKLDSIGIVGRWGHYDPAASTLDAKAWAVWTTGANLWWSAPEKSRFMTGLGHQVTVPMNADLPIEQALMLQGTLIF